VNAAFIKMVIMNVNRFLVWSLIATSISFFSNQSNAQIDSSVYRSYTYQGKTIPFSNQLSFKTNHRIVLTLYNNNNIFSLKYNFGRDKGGYIEGTYVIKADRKLILESYKRKYKFRIKNDLLIEKSPPVFYKKVFRYH
jgi:hypothetical protein